MQEVIVGIAESRGAEHSLSAYALESFDVDCGGEMSWADVCSVKDRSDEGSRISKTCCVFKGQRIIKCVARHGSNISALRLTVEAPNLVYAKMNELKSRVQELIEVGALSRNIGAVSCLVSHGSKYAKMLTFDTAITGADLREDDYSPEMQDAMREKWNSALSNHVEKAQSVALDCWDPEW